MSIMTGVVFQFRRETHGKTDCASKLWKCCSKKSSELLAKAFAQKGNGCCQNLKNCSQNLVFLITEIALIGCLLYWLIININILHFCSWFNVSLAILYFCWINANFPSTGGVGPPTALHSVWIHPWIFASYILFPFIPESVNATILDLSKTGAHRLITAWFEENITPLINASLMFLHTSSLVPPLTR
jgi:hypothetical protein